MSTADHLDCFISGLRDDIGCELQLWQPYSVPHAYGLAKQIEANFQFDLHLNELRLQLEREIPKIVAATFTSICEKHGSSSQTLDSDLDSDDDFVVNSDSVSSEVDTTETPAPLLSQPPPASGIIAKPDSAFLDSSVSFAATEDRKKFVLAVFTDLGLSIPALVHSECVPCAFDTPCADLSTVLVPRVLYVVSTARFNPQLLPEHCVSLPPNVLTSSTVTTQSVRDIPVVLSPRDTPPPAPPDKFAVPPLALPPKPPDRTIFTVPPPPFDFAMVTDTTPQQFVPPSEDSLRAPPSYHQPAESHKSPCSFDLQRSSTVPFGLFTSGLLKAHHNAQCPPPSGTILSKPMFGSEEKL